MNKLKYLAIALIAVAGLGLQQAQADVFNFQLSQGNTALTTAGFSGPYANVSVTTAAASNVAQITFTSLTQTVGGNSYIYLFGDGSSVAVNASAASTITGLASVGLPGFNAPLLSDGGAGNVDGFGTMNHTVNNFDGFSHATNSITFSLTKTGGGVWGAASTVLTPNNQGAIAAAHIFVTLNPPNQANGAAVTGFAAPGGSIVPDGGTTVMLLGMALGALGMVRRYLTS